MSGFNMDGYVDVAERIREFAAKYPEGSLSSDLQLIHREIDEKTYLLGWLCTARAYRTPDDPQPGVGHAFEQIPGKTPYTKDSEAMNAETSAWGRAIVALGFDTKKIASAEEVQARQGAGDGKVADPHGQNLARGDSVEPGQVIVTFGKHRDKMVKDVPRSYWEWWLAQDGKKNEQIKAAVELHLGLTQQDGPDDDLDGLPF